MLLWTRARALGVIRRVRRYERRRSIYGLTFMEQIFERLGFATGVTIGLKEGELDLDDFTYFNVGNCRSVGRLFVDVQLNHGGA